MTGAKVWKVGLELELLAPVDGSRKTLADAIARGCGASVKRIFYPQSEFALMQDATVFENLTLGFAVESDAGGELVKCVDDLTIVDDLDATKPAMPGWYRIISDDQRFLSLVERHCDASCDHLSVLEPLAQLYGVDLETANDEPLMRVCDQRGASIAMAATLPGERHRPCELITAPLRVEREETIARYLKLAADLSFKVPAEAAVHIHFDGEALKSAAAMTSLVTLFGHYRADLKRLIGTNPNWRRVGDWPKAVYRLAARADFAELDWPQAREKLRKANPVKFCDFNFVNLLADSTDKNTFEVRTIPGSMDAEFIVTSIRLFEALLKVCVAKKLTPGSELPDLQQFLCETDLGETDLDYWRRRWQANAGQGKFSLLQKLRKLK